MADNETETVTISKKRYQELIDDAFMLECLSSAGVDNWEGYEYACDMYHSEE